MGIYMLLSVRNEITFIIMFKREISLFHFKTLVDSQTELSSIKNYEFFFCKIAHIPTKLA